MIAGFTLFLSSPIVGVGFGHYFEGAASLFGSQGAVGAHNWYTYILGEQGLVGALLWLSFVVTIAYRMLRRPSRPRSVGLPVLAAFAAACFFLEVPTSFQTFSIPAIVLVAALVAAWPSETGASEAQAESPARPFTSVRAAHAGSR